MAPIINGRHTPRADEPFVVFIPGCGLGFTKMLPAPTINARQV